MAMEDSLASMIGERSVPRLGLLARVLYGVGEITDSVKMAIFGIFVFFFYTTVVGLPATLVGIASGIGLVWDAAIDPFIGYFSDRVRVRFGRRHSFMLVGGSTVGLLFWALFSPPRDLPTEALFAWLLISSLLVRLASSVFFIPYRALGAELSGGYHDRTTLTGVRAACGLLGAMLAASLSFSLFFPNRVPGQDPKLDYAGYPIMGLVFGLAMSLAALVATAATLRWRSNLPTSESTLTGNTPGFASGTIGALRHTSFRVLFLSFSLIFLGLVITDTLFIHYLTYYVEIIDSSALSGLQAVFYTAAILGVPVWLRISRTAEKRTLYLLATIATALLILSAFLLLGNGRRFGTGDARPLMVGRAIGGFFGSLFWILPTSMLADVADEDTLATGQRRQGIFFGLFSFGQQFATGLSVLIVGVLMERFAGLAPGEATQSPRHLSESVCSSVCYRPGCCSSGLSL